MNVTVSAEMMNVMSSSLSSVLIRAITMCSEKYNFSAADALKMIGVIKVTVDNGSSVSQVKESRSRTRVKQVKSSFPLPFSGEQIASNCFALRQNNGLYTQCQSVRETDGAYCKSCEAQSLKNNGTPEYGCIQHRMKMYENGEDFLDPSGKSPVAYLRVMKKLKLTQEQVLEEAGKLNVKVDASHFVEIEKKSSKPVLDKELKPKGRPKKSKKVLELEGEEEDLFASLVMTANAAVKSVVSEVMSELVTKVANDVEETSDAEETSNTEEVSVAKVSKAKVPKETKKKVVTDEEKQKKEDAQLLKESLKILKNADNLKKETEKKQKADDKLKKDAEKLEKETTKLQKETEKKQKAEDKLKKDSEKVSDKPKEKKVKASAVVASAVVASAVTVVEEEEADVVKKIVFEGKKYLRSKNTGIIYNEDQEVIGKWNEAKQRIDFTQTSEESEDEYDEDE